MHKDEIDFSNELDCVGDDANKYSYWHVDDNFEPDDDCNRDHNKNKCDKCHRHHCKKVCATGATRRLDYPQNSHTTAVTPIGSKTGKPYYY